MHETLLRVFVVAFGLLISSRDNPGLKETDEIILQKHKERMMSDGAWSEEEAEDVSTHLHEAQSEAQRWDEETRGKKEELEESIGRDDEFKIAEPNQTQVKRESNDGEQMLQSSEMDRWDRDLLWYMWNIFSFLSTLHFLRKYLRNKSARPLGDEVQLPDSDTLLRFYSKRLHHEHKNLWGEEFLDGFANDLLASTRVVCERHGGMTIQDFKTVDVSDVIVPLIPLEPYMFQCLLRKDEAHMQSCGQVKVVRSERTPNTCYCQSPDAEDDMVCLLHCETANTKTYDSFTQLCVTNTTFLSKSQTIRWFRHTLKQAWTEISHKYDFKVTISSLDDPCSLVILFKSGRRLHLKLNPVVELNCDAHLCITHYPENPESLWTLSLRGYEDTVLDYISKQLPDEACHMQVLEISRFLHQRQVAVTGACALNNHHFKTALIHILLRTKPAQWKSNQIASRLRDLLVFLEESLQKRSLHHAVVGSAHAALKLPAELTRAGSVNLFHPLVVHECIYRHSVAHYKEMLQNSHMLILDYVGEECAAHC